MLPMSQPAQPVAHGVFTVERTYPYPPARVFKANADQAAKRRWFAEGSGFEILDYVLDFRVGGTETTRYRHGGGPEVRNDTQFQDITQDQRIVFSYRMTIADQPISVSLSTIELTAVEGGTHLKFTEQGVYYGADDQIPGRIEGSQGLLERLAAELDRQAKH